MLSEALNALIVSDFIVKYVPFGMSKRNEHYKLMDPFCIFYLHFVKTADEINESFCLGNVENVNAPAATRTDSEKCGKRTFFPCILKRSVLK